MLSLSSFFALTELTGGRLFLKHALELEQKLLSLCSFLVSFFFFSEIVYRQVFGSERSLFNVAFTRLSPSLNFYLNLSAFTSINSIHTCGA